MPAPVNSNIKSNTCGEPMNSNCVIYGGPDIPGMSVCRGASITDVIYAIGKCSCASVSSCYTGNWVDFSSIITASGSGVACTYILVNTGIFDGYTITAYTAVDNPSYKWTATGCLKFKGCLSISLTTTGAQAGNVIVNLASVPTSCLPTGFKTQLVLVEVEDRPTSTNSDIFFKAYLLLSDTGSLQLLIEWVNMSLSIVAPTHNYSISLNGIEFNF